MQLRTNARGRVRVSVTGASRADLRLKRIHHAVFVGSIPKDLERAAELIVHIDGRRDGRTAEFRFPVVAVAGP